MKIVIIIATALFLSLATNNTIVAQDAQTESISVKVKGAGCHKDINAITKQVEALEGVVDCSIEKSGAVSTFVIQYDPAQVDAAAIHAAIEDTPGCEGPEDRPFTVKKK